MSELISRQDAIEAVTRAIWHYPNECYKNLNVYEVAEALVGDAIKSIPSAEPCDKDAVSREGLLRSWEELSPRGRTEFDQVIMTIPALPSAGPKTGRNCTDFVRWLMDEVMDEENWQMNAVANGEIICRKLKKLGLLDVVDGYYVETQKTGEWVRHELWDTPWYTCSECDSHGRNDYKFCPNCGARMLGEDGEE